MTTGAAPPGDQVKVSVLVDVDAAEAFRVFTDEIDQWWRRGPRFRAAGKARGIIRIEPRLGGRLFESFETSSGERVVETGKVLVWEPAARLVLEWRNVNFAPAEKTEVEVTFEPRAGRTLVTVVHRGFASLRPDHPARHGLPIPDFIRMMGMWWGDLMTSLRRRVAPEE